MSDKEKAGDRRTRSSETPDRHSRAASALRDNLARRKAQQRARRAAQSAESTDRKSAKSKPDPAD
ncbi:MAG: hypothetical protein AAF530_01195 [Pseudomonadota bacterium]